MLSADSLVLDLIFQANAEIDPAELTEALGGEEALKSLTILDPDTQDPRLEMELSPSMPFRRRGERRLMLIDSQAGPLRDAPTDPVVERDLRPAKEKLLKLCHTLAIRFARIFALGSWGDAVWIARDAVDFRGIALISWVLDPNVDVDGKRRASQLSQPEFEEKIKAYDKRLEELDEAALLKRTGSASFVRDGDYLILDVLDDQGYWDLRTSAELETSMAALDLFALLPGAPVAVSKAEPEKPQPEDSEPRSNPESDLAQAAIPWSMIGDELFFVFSKDQFNLDIAAALGKQDWDLLLKSSQEIPGPTRDLVFKKGAQFAASIEFLSEVSVDGKPLDRTTFEKDARDIGNGNRALEVHVPRFGHGTLLVAQGGQRIITSGSDHLEQVIQKMAAL